MLPLVLSLVLPLVLLLELLSLQLELSSALSLGQLVLVLSMAAPGGSIPLSHVAEAISRTQSNDLMCRMEDAAHHLVLHRSLHHLRQA